MSDAFPSSMRFFGVFSSSNFLFFVGFCLPGYCLANSNLIGLVSYILLFIALFISERFLPMQQSVLLFISIFSFLLVELFFQCLLCWDANVIVPWLKIEEKHKARKSIQVEA